MKFRLMNHRGTHAPRPSKTTSNGSSRKPKLVVAVTRTLLKNT